MKKVLLLLFLSSKIILLSGCSLAFLYTTSPIDNEDGKNMTVLFSDTANIMKEDNYYDAILELQSKFPDENQSFIIIDSNEKEIVRHYGITTFPTMLVLHGESEQIRMVGPQSKENIITTLENAIQLTSQNEPVS